MKFHRDSSSDDESDDVVQLPPAPVRNIPPQAARWYAPDSDDEDVSQTQRARTALSAEERQLQRIDDAINTLELLVDEGHWESGVKKLQILINLTDDFMKVGSVDSRTAPPQVLAFINQLLEITDEALRDTSQFSDPVELKACRVMASRLRLLLQRIAPAAVIPVAVPSSGITTPTEPVSEAESYLRGVMKCATSQTVLRFLQLSAVAKMPRQVYVYALTTMASMILATGSELVSLPSGLLRNALEAATSGFQVVVDERLVVDTSAKPHDGMPFNPTSARRTYVAGGFEGLVASIYQQWRRTLQDHSIHIDRRRAALDNEALLLELADKVLDWATARNIKSTISSVALTLLRLIAPMPQSHFSQVTLKIQSSRFQVGQLLLCESLRESITSATEEVRREVLLLMAFAVAQLGDYRAAKVSCLKEPSLADPSLPVYQKILLNRCSVAIALGAFRAGALRETLDGLKDLLARERRADFSWPVLIGQGRIANRLLDNADVTEEDRLRAGIFFFDCQVPVHHVIDTKFVIKCFLVSCILTLCRQEREPSSDRLRDDAFLPTYYFEFLRQVKRNVFPKPLQTVDELCHAFRTAIHRGDARDAQTLLQQLNIAYPPIVEATTDAALRTYSERLGANFTCVSVAYLAEQFGVDVSNMRRMLVRLICEGSLNGQLEEGDDVMYCEPPTSDVQRLINLTASALFATESGERSGGRFKGRGRGSRPVRYAPT